jgi:hypothetical protein
MSVAAKRIPGLGEENISISDAVGPAHPSCPAWPAKFVRILMLSMLLLSDTSAPLTL